MTPPDHFATVREALEKYAYGHPVHPGDPNYDQRFVLCQASVGALSALAEIEKGHLAELTKMALASMNREQDRIVALLDDCPIPEPRR